ncbi:hypothetical protein [Salirhabdus sp. Marseille-P4669]|uniref:hypothetical protein n=1 Tax=Salirhabdus sp. Marseille-P4669 TaxID=2042310 RepID=UPI000C7D0353|nr:hypothetical protein [Salirhabdus sp. Marseille-P4669]
MGNFIWSELIGELLSDIDELCAGFGELPILVGELFTLIDEFNIITVESRAVDEGFQLHIGALLSLFMEFYIAQFQTDVVE